MLFDSFLYQEDQKLMIESEGSEEEKKRERERVLKDLPDSTFFPPFLSWKDAWQNLQRELS